MEEAQSLAIHDMLIWNLCMGPHNLLKAKKGSDHAEYNLIAIDHGLSFRSPTDGLEGAFHALTRWDYFRAPSTDHARSLLTSFSSTATCSANASGQWACSLLACESQHSSGRW